MLNIIFYTLLIIGIILAINYVLSSFLLKRYLKKQYDYHTKIGCDAFTDFGMKIYKNGEIKPENKPINY
ncbi:hypothetical protein [Caminibacter pacificus]